MPAIGQLRGFEPPQSSCAQVDPRKARERVLATFDENRRAVGMLTPMRDKIEGTYRGGEGTTPVATACPEDR